MNWYQNFFFIGQLPADAMTGAYNFKLVALSYIIATITSYVALDMSSHLKQKNSTLFNISWWGGGAIIMGTGIWSMHFIGMLAYSMDMSMTYNLFWTVLSMFIAILAAGIAFVFFTIKKPKTIHYFLCGLTLGSAILAMHYSGMAGMENLIIRYKPNIFGLSVLIAVTAATVAVWLSAHGEKGTYSKQLLIKIGSGLIMGIAIAGMHYTGMYAAVMTPTESMIHGIAVDPIVLAILIATIVISVLIIAIIISTTKYYISTKLKNDKYFLEVILNSLEGGVLAFDTDRKLILYNDTTKDFFRDIEQLKSDVNNWRKCFPLLKIENKEPYAYADYPLERVYAGKEVKDMEVIIKNSENNERFLSIDAQLLTGENHEHIGSVIVYQDITKRKKIDLMKTEFISTVSHELRTPLTSIRGALGLIMGGAMGDIPKKIESLLEIASKNSERLVRLINDILDTEKIEAGKMVFNFEKRNLSSLVEQAVITNNVYADKYNVILIIKNFIPDVMVRMDQDRINQVLDNLLSNAAKFSSPHSTTTISMARYDGLVRISICNPGPGIPKESQARIFSKFYQADASDVRKKGGTGLGLSICKSIIESHNGNIGFRSTQNIDTTFHFDLIESNIETSNNIEHKKTTQKEQNNTVLICEDEPDVGKLLGLMLKEHGFNSVNVTTIAEAKETLEKNNFCLMTLDILLPDGNGLELLKWMRSKTELEQLPVVIISAISIEQEKIKAAALGVVDWINKPIDENRLYRNISQCIDNKKQNTKGKAKVLHIEDDEDIAKIVSTVIKDICDTDTSPTIATAISLLSKTKYDLIILDLNLKDGSGYDILSYLEENAYRTPVLILSVDEPETGISKNIAASLIKSKTSNHEIWNKIVCIIENNCLKNEDDTQ